ncbi:MAG: FtsW/RodA/SpoVE family cell cycle protein, partial [Candidatus ainarchaeum sp.]|nr:FtsW/RodA/SpoVE family cell cycle protein [Candidatus ainarchaeum sp.]
RGPKLASGVTDQFRKLLAPGIIVSLVAQAFINISAIIGLVPLTGITLPFISHGGTSMAISLSAVGILANISKNSSFK